MTQRHHTGADMLLTQFDKALRTLAPGKVNHQRPSPALQFDEADMTEKERQHAAGLMRINHAGEVCAQALYQGQALTAKLPQVRAEMEMAAEEEVDHLGWCQDRIHALGSHTSVLNPLWYGMSFGIGAAAGLIGDKVSLGFVAATEQQVCKHLESHLERLPPQDQKSTAVIETMLEDEAKHANLALEAGGIRFPAPVKAGMSLVSHLMTKSSYRI